MLSCSLTMCIVACLLPPCLLSHTVYFVQGILKLSSLAVTFFFKDILKMEPAQVLHEPTRGGYLARRVGVHLGGVGVVCCNVVCRGAQPEATPTPNTHTCFCLYPACSHPPPLPTHPDGCSRHHHQPALCPQHTPSPSPHPTPHTQMAVADTITNLPWAVKPLYGFITDSFPIAGMRRRPYLILAGLLGKSVGFGKGCVVKQLCLCVWECVGEEGYGAAPTSYWQDCSVSWGGGHTAVVGGCF
jgi:hypothetical protein